MARNGSGVYSLPAGSTITNGDTSDATDLNTPLQDLETDANTARPVVAGGTGATTASGARTNLGLVIGTNVQAHSANLDTIAAQVTGLSGSDTDAVTGTAGTDGNLAQWNADGDIVDGPDVLDEDDMASDSAAAVPTQQSVKAYVDAMPLGGTLSEPARVLNTTYQNTTGNNILVTVSVTQTGAKGTLRVQTASNSGLSADVRNYYQTVDASERGTVTFVVPTDHYYQVDDLASGGVGAFSLVTWSEVA